jgi:hypothetical protein
LKQQGNTTMQYNRGVLIREAGCKRNKEIGCRAARILLLIYRTTGSYSTGDCDL